MKAIIVGAGIGGLATAICLRLRGHTVQIIEQSPEIREIGAGLQISANGYRVLQAMGLNDLLTEVEFRPDAIEMRMGKSGRKLFRLKIKDISEKRWGAPYVHIHRADLVAALHARINELGGVKIITGAPLTEYRQSANGVVAQFEGGRAYGDFLIGADGIHSVVRRQMQGLSALRFTGNMAWRTVVPMSWLRSEPPPPTACIWAGAGKHVVTTRLRKGSIVNFVGIVERDNWQEEGWRIKGDKDEALKDFEGWHPTIPGILKAAPKLHRWALFDRPPLSHWSDGNVCLLGDACHPMLPSMAQGAVQAIEDAWVLAGCLSGADPEPAFRRYFKIRNKRTTAVQKGSAKNLAMFHRKSALTQAAGYAPLWLAGRVMPSVFHRRQDWVYGHDVLSQVPALR